METAPRFSPKIAVFIGCLIVGIALIIIAGKGGFARASDDRPIDVTVTPNSANSVTVNWSTGNATQGQVLYSNDIEGPDKYPSIAPETSPTTSHSVVLTLLEADKMYYFKIKIGENMYDNGGIAWSFTTPSSEAVITPSASLLSPTATASATLPSKAVTKAVSKLSITPIQHLKFTNPAVTTTVAPTASTSTKCTYSSCQEIPTKYGKGCSTQDYIRCLKNQ
jgi:hypothetical protein